MEEHNIVARAHAEVERLDAERNRLMQWTEDCDVELDSLIRQVEGAVVDTCEEGPCASSRFSPQSDGCISTRSAAQACSMTVPCQLALWTLRQATPSCCGKRLVLRVKVSGSRINIPSGRRDRLGTSRRRLVGVRYINQTLRYPGGDVDDDASGEDRDPDSDASDSEADPETDDGSNVAEDLGAGDESAFDGVDEA